MITSEQLKAVGKFLKPHGISGEIALQSDYYDLDFGAFNFVFTDIDGIFVPFAIESMRTKGVETYLLKLDDIDDEEQATMLTNKTAYLLRSEVAEARRAEAEADSDGEEGDDPDDEGFYADDLVGLTAFTDDGKKLGRVIDINDSTANYLLVIETDASGRLLIPLAGEFISAVDPEAKTLILSLPEGILEL